MSIKAERKEGMNFAAEIISGIKRQLARCRTALMVSLGVNIILAAAVCRIMGRRGRHYAWK